MSETSKIAHAIQPQQVRSTRFLIRVLDAAERILKQEGPDGLTMPMVALGAGVSVGGIYRRFQTKRDLLRAIKDRHLNSLEAAVASALESDLQSLGEVARTFVGVLFKGEDDPLLSIILANQGDDPLMHARGRQAIDRMQDLFFAAMEPHRSEIRHPDPDVALTMALHLVITTHIGRVQAKGNKTERMPLPTVRRELGRLITAYLTAAP